ncbi:MAG: response regulator, partial [Lachnospiraceae bacterium]|nr:response regulator [Lachnospiraceae bacterium]
KGRHFLVAEDNEINSEILMELLRGEGVTCVVAETGRLAVDAFTAAAPGTYDAILMDVQMPVMNGYDATREIRALGREDAASIPIIAMTANAFAEDVKNALDAGMNDHIAKPIDIEIIKKVLGKYLSPPGLPAAGQNDALMQDT